MAFSPSGDERESLVGKYATGEAQGPANVLGGLSLERVPSGRLGRRGDPMLRPKLVGMLAAVLITGCERTDEFAPTGQSLYLRHCAACHGITGEGAGPLASSLRTPPADLTRISERSGGNFDDAAVMAIIDGRRVVREHGPREMPVWGAVFEEQLQGESHGSYTALLHGRALTDYLGSLQRETE